MDILTAIISGIVQGLTEFLPVSSSGHLALINNIFAADFNGDSLAFTVLLHLGTLAAVIAVYYRDVWELIKGFFSLMKKLFTGHIRDGLEKGERLFLMLCVATVPLVIGAILSDKVEALSGMSWCIGIFLILNGAMLWLADKLAGGKLTIEQASFKQALIIGVIQLIGIMPGISRSGSTITGGLFTGFERKDAVKFSFLLSIPAILGANILELPALFSDASLAENLLPYTCGIIAAAISGFAAIKLLQYITRSNKLSVFSLYCAAVGAAAIIYSIVA